MGKKKFLDKKKAATFVLMHRDTQGADDDVSARVFTRVDAGFAPVKGFSEEDPRTNPDYGYETDDGEEEDEDEDGENGGAGAEESSVFADAEEDDDVRSRRSMASRSTRRSTASRAAHKGPLPEHVRVELVELGFPDDGYDYMQHMRKIGVSGVGGSFVPTTRPKPEKLRADVKVFDASKVAVQAVEEANEKKIIAAVGSSTHQMRRPAYVEHGLDPEVAAALDDSEGSEFGSADELEDDFVVFANNNAEGSTSGEFQGGESAAARNSNLRLESSLVEGDEDEGEWSESDSDARSGVSAENERPRPSRLLDEQFEKLAMREYDDDEEEFDEEDPEARGHADISQFDDVLSEFLSDPKVFGDKYMTPAEIEREHGASVSKAVQSGRSPGARGASKEGDSSAARGVLERSAESTADVRIGVEGVEGEAGVGSSDDDELVVIEVESEDERSNWDCETVVSTLSNLDNHPGKISAPGKARRKAPSLGKVLEDKEVSGGMIKLRGKQSLPTDFLPVRAGAERAKQLKSAGKAGEAKAKPVSRAGETPEERKARKAAVKEERRDARAAKKALKILYKDESQRAQHGAANTGPSGIHLP
ncbi:hypothetical protein KC19_1G150700 [Ceratodon purpureus]|uniref:LTV1 n=1 Tax=Ceratodon purpureus TaxID=3225 RepID=A0A8T0J8A9_CERPU|nr:hypothetical protein KC19_1G150700 [Ceratodon purpureus]